MNRKAMPWLIGALALMSGLCSAQASMLGYDPSDTATVLYSQSDFVLGSASNVTTLNVPGPGELFLTLTDLDFLVPFASLQFSLTNTSTALVGLADPGTLTLDLTKPTTLYADVFANAQGSADVGLYNLTATFVSSSTAVPLPPTGVLLGATLLVLLLGWCMSTESTTAVVSSYDSMTLDWTGTVSDTAYTAA